MKKVISLILGICFTVTAAMANHIDKALAKSKINHSAISISVKELNTGKVLYQHNQKKPMMPASTLKAVTYIAALKELGKDYNFTTSLYKTADNELIFKLGADPFLNNFNLKELLQAAKDKEIIEPKAIKFDDSIIDNVEWGEGWQWDDDINPLMPKFSAYNIDENMLIVNIDPTSIGAPAEIRLKEFFPMTFMNLVTTGKETSIKASRNNSISPDTITIEGTVAEHRDLRIPVNYPKRYFVIRLSESLRSRKILYYGNFTTALLPKKNVYLIKDIKNPISKATVEVMQNSNNLVAETVFKIAGGHYANKTGNVKDAVDMTLNHCKDLDVNAEDIRIADGSGVSKNNLVTADFMTNFLISQSKSDSDYRQMFANPGEGTLKKRMLYLGDKLEAKTGTLSDVSALTGFITTLSGKTYAFDIMINDAKSSNADKKMLEEYIIRAIYSNY